MKRVLLLMLLCMVLVGCGTKAVPEQDKNVSSVSTEETFPVKKPKKGLQTILVMGLDKFERTDVGPMGYMNDMQSDFLALVVVEPERNFFRMLHLNRDTMTKIKRLGVFGDSAGSFVGQLALAHTYGSGGSDSCINAVEAVSNLLGGIPIDHYMTFTMDSVPVLNDMVGGVTVTITDDFSAVDGTLKQGDTMTLHGDQALTYVRTRRDVGDQSNLERMERQREYLSQLYLLLLDKMAGDDGFTAKVTLALGDSFQTDCSLNQLSELSKHLSTCTMGDFAVIPGEAVKGEEFMEFYVNEDGLQQVVDELFYES